MNYLSNKSKSIISIIIAAFSFSLLSIIIKIGYKFKLSSEYITISQFFYGSLLFILFIIIFNYKNVKLVSLKKIKLKDLIYFIFTGFFLYLTTYLYNKTLILLPASISIILLFQYPWISIILDLILERTYPKKNIMIGMVILIIGTFLSGGIFTKKITYNTYGILLGLLSAVSYTFYMYFNKKKHDKISNFTQSFIIVLSASIISVLMFMIYSIRNINVVTYLLYTFQMNLLKPNDLLIYICFGFLVGLFGSFIPSYFLVYGSKNLTLSLVSILSSMELPIVILLSFIILKESIFLHQIIGIIISLFGIFISQLDA